MEGETFYTLPELPYDYNALVPYISEEQLRLHHTKHHQAYVTGANAVFERLDKARKENATLDMKATMKELSFHMGGYRLHNKFWTNMAPPGKGGGGTPKGDFAKVLENDFGNFARFKLEFSQVATSVEGSGWAMLSYCPKTGRLVPLQIEKHNVNLIPAYDILLVLDVWEHAYYLDYKNDRAKFVESFWNLVNWDEVSSRFERVKTAHGRRK